MNKNTQATATRPTRVVCIDDFHAAAAETREWVHRLRSVGLNAGGLRLVRATKLAEAALGGLIAIGRDTGAETGHWLLTAARARAAVLLDPAFAPVRHTYGPLLLVNNADCVDVIAETLGKDGICDQHLVNVTADTLTTGKTGTNFAHYIRSWLDFHQLLRQGH